MSVVQYDEKLCHLLDTYDKLFLVHADNVGSKQFQDIRRVSQYTPGLSSNCLCLSAPGQSMSLVWMYPVIALCPIMSQPGWVLRCSLPSLRGKF